MIMTRTPKINNFIFQPYLQTKLNDSKTTYFHIHQNLGKKNHFKTQKPCFINCLLIIRPLFDTQLPNGYYPYFHLKVKIAAVTFLTKK